MAERGTRHAECVFNSVGEDGTFQGYASLFGVVDSYGTTFAKGAFSETIKDRVADIKLLRNHDWDSVVGKFLEIREDDVGLFVRGQLDMNIELARETASLMRTGALDGLSVAFEYLDENTEKDGDVVVIKKADLQEISVVTFPSLETATVDTRTLFDTLTLDGALRKTEDGYLTGYARAARVGIQKYKGSELGRPDLDVVRVYRPEAEVFDRRSLQSYAHRPVTNDHPPVAVTADNWKKFAVGHVSDEVIRDKEFVRVPLVLMDSAAIRDVEGGKNELSLGYTTDIRWTPGVAPGGEKYDAVQTGIRANHLAIVAAARGGSDLRLGDEQKEKEMKIIVVDGISVEVADDRTAQIIERHLRALEKQSVDLRAKLDEEEEKKKAKEAKDAQTLVDHKTALDTLRGENEALKKQVADAAMTPEKLDALVKDRAIVVDKAFAILGEKLVKDGKSLDEIRRQVVDHELGDAAKDWSKDTIAGAFNALVAKVETRDGVVVQLSDAISRNTSRTALTDGDKAHADYVKNLGSAYKNQVAK